MISSNRKRQQIDLSHSSVWDTINSWVPDLVLWDPLKASAEGTWEQTIRYRILVTLCSAVASCTVLNRQVLPREQAHNM